MLFSSERSVKLSGQQDPFSCHYSVPAMNNVRANQLADFPTTDQLGQMLLSCSTSVSLMSTEMALGCLSSSNRPGMLQAQPQSASEPRETSSLSHPEKMWERKNSEGCMYHEMVTGNLVKSNTSDKTKVWPHVLRYHLTGCPGGFLSLPIWKKNKKQTNPPTWKERRWKKCWELSS